MTSFGKVRLANREPSSFRERKTLRFLQKMSVNKIQCDNGRLTLFGDYVIYHQDGVEFSLEGDGIPGFLKGTKKGNVFISTSKCPLHESSETSGKTTTNKKDRQVVFAPSSGCSFGSFSMNFQSIRNVEVKQPMFGANHIKGDIISEPEGGWQGRGIFKIIFNSGGAIEFAEHFRMAVQRARSPGAPPPPPTGHQQVIGQFYPAPPPQQPYGPPPQQPYAPPPAGYYPYPPGPPAGQPYTGYNAYPSAPPAPYMAQPPPAYQPNSENPPPYVGSDAKAREAYSTGANVYVPQSQPPPYAPPPYSSENKKDV